MTVETHIVRGEHILIGFLRAFFKQEKLFQKLPNEFVYKDNKTTNSLLIQMVDNYDQESEDATPALVIQEGGFNERMERIDQRETHNWVDTEHKKAALEYNYSIHCITREKGTCKFLQSAVSKGIMGFRKAIYALGINKIRPLQGGAPQNLGGSTQDHPGPYDATIRLGVVMDQDFILVKGDEPEEAVEFKIRVAVDELEYDSSGNINTPSDEWFEM